MVLFREAVDVSRRMVYRDGSFLRKLCGRSRVRERGGEAEPPAGRYDTINENHPVLIA